MPDKPDDNLTEEASHVLDSVWGDRTLGLSSTGVDWDRPVTSEELAGLLRRYPFIQIMNSEARWDQVVLPDFKKMSNGWVVHSYADQAMSTSPGKYLFGLGNPELKSEEGGEGGEGAGTLIKQAFDVVQAMIAIAAEKGWAAVDIIAGTPFMKWAAWMAAQDKGLEIMGYDPTEEDKKKREHILRAREEIEKEARMAPSQGPGGVGQK